MEIGTIIGAMRGSSALVRSSVRLNISPGEGREVRSVRSILSVQADPPSASARSSSRTRYVLDMK